MRRCSLTFRFLSGSVFLRSCRRTSTSFSWCALRASRLSTARNPETKDIDGIPVRELLDRISLRIHEIVHKQYDGAARRRAARSRARGHSLYRSFGLHAVADEIPRRVLHVRRISPADAASHQRGRRAAEHRQPPSACGIPPEEQHRCSDRPAREFPRDDGRSFRSRRFGSRRVRGFSGRDRTAANQHSPHRVASRGGRTPLFHAARRRRSYLRPAALSRLQHRGKPPFQGRPRRRLRCRRGSRRRLHCGDAGSARFAPVLAPHAPHLRRRQSDYSYLPKGQYGLCRVRPLSRSRSHRPSDSRRSREHRRIRSSSQPGLEKLLARRIAGRRSAVGRVQAD